MNLAPAIDNHIVIFAQLLIISISEQRRQLVLLACITIKFLRTFYIPVVRLRNSLKHKPKLLIKMTIRIASVCIAYDTSRMRLPETGKKFRCATHNGASDFRGITNKLPTVVFVEARFAECHHGNQLPIVEKTISD